MLILLDFPKIPQTKYLWLSVSFAERRFFRQIYFLNVAKNVVYLMGWSKNSANHIAKKLWFKVWKRKISNDHNSVNFANWDIRLAPFDNIFKALSNGKNLFPTIKIEEMAAISIFDLWPLVTSGQGRFRIFPFGTKHP